MTQKINQQEAAERFAAKIQKLAEDGRIESLSIKVQEWSSDELFTLAHAAGIRDLTVSATFGA